VTIPACTPTTSATCRLGAAIADATGLQLAADDPVTHGTTLADPPERPVSAPVSKLPWPPAEE
jgi:hypothetical protein